MLLLTCSTWPHLCHLCACLWVCMGWADALEDSRLFFCCFLMPLWLPTGKAVGCHHGSEAFEPWLGHWKLSGQQNPMILGREEGDCLSQLSQYFVPVLQPVPSLSSAGVLAVETKKQVRAPSCYGGTSSLCVWESYSWVPPTPCFFLFALSLEWVICH